MTKKIIIVFLGVCFLYICLSVAIIYPSYSRFQRSVLNFSELNEANYNDLFKNLSELHTKLKALKPFLSLTPQYQKRYEQIDKVVRAKPVLDRLNAFDDEKTFLVVMQNNAELRPSGGFWGSYGVLKIKNAKITSFKTADSYNLDLQNKGKFTPPEEIKDIVEDEWRFWNSNWSPDFKYSVEQGLFFYKQVEPDAHFDGVLGPNVDFLLETLKVTGPVDVPEHSFKVEENNFLQKMVYESTDPAVYASKKDDPNFIYPTDKKPLLADLAKNIFEKVSSSGNLNSFLLVSYRALENKDLLFYFPDEDLEKKANDLNWAGSLTDKNNFIEVVDANLGSKLDFFMNKKLNIKEVGPCEYLGKLTYSNEYQENSKVTPLVIYRSLSRIFLPKDAVLLDFSGGQRVSALNFEPQTNTSYLSTLLVTTPGEDVTFDFHWKSTATCNNQKLMVIRQPGSKLSAEISE